MVPHLYPADVPLPRERAKAPYSPVQIAGYLALADSQPTMERRMRAAGLVCLGAGAGLIRGDFATRAAPMSRAVPAEWSWPFAAAGRGTCRCWPATTRGCWTRPGSPGARRSAAALIRPEHHELAGHRAGRRERPAPAGHQQAARDLAGRLRGSTGAGHVHACRRDQLLPAARRPGRRARTGRRGRGGPAPRSIPAVMITLAALEEVIDASGIAPDRGQANK